MLVPLKKFFSQEPLSRFTLATTSWTRSFTQWLWPSQITHPVYTSFQDTGDRLFLPKPSLRPWQRHFSSPPGQVKAKLLNPASSATLLCECAGAGTHTAREGRKAEGKTVSSLERGHALHTPVYGDVYAYWQPMGRPECLGLGRLSKRVLPSPSLLHLCIFAVLPSSTQQ